MLARPRYVSFQTKALVLVVTVMVLLVAVMMFVVNQRITRQLQSDAAQALMTADAVLKSSQKKREKDLLLHFKNVANQSQYIAACQLADTATLQNSLNQLLGEELSSDLVQYKSAAGRLIANARRNPALDLSEFEQHSQLSAAQAIEDTPNADTIRVGDRLFDVISVPVKVLPDRVAANVMFEASGGVTAPLVSSTPPFFPAL